MVKKSNGARKSFRKDGAVNVTLEPDVVDRLDGMIKQVEPILGFKPNRSQGLKYLLKQIEHLYGGSDARRS